MSFPGRVRRASVLLAAALTVAAPALCRAATLEVTVVDADGRPVPCVAVYAMRRVASADASTLGAAAPRTSAVISAPAAPTAETKTTDARCATSTHAAHAVIDQKDSAFVPHMLVVERGTAVTFPNSDSVSHHVYSFSDAKRFELALYKGDRHPPLVFDRAGVVVLGCNIHDRMLGYVVVVDTSHFATTDAAGRAVLHGLAAGAYAVDLFTPRAKPKDAPSAVVTVADRAAVTRLELAFKSRLAQPNGNASDSLTWQRY